MRHSYAERMLTEGFQTAAGALARRAHGQRVNHLLARGERREHPPRLV
jgi:hypothetical protein